MVLFIRNENPKSRLLDRHSALSYLSPHHARSTWHFQASKPAGFLGEMTVLPNPSVIQEKRETLRFCSPIAPNLQQFVKPQEVYKMPNSFIGPLIFLPRKRNVWAALLHLVSISVPACLPAEISLGWGSLPVPGQSSGKLRILSPFWLCSAPICCWGEVHFH